MVGALCEVALLVTDGPPHKRDNPGHRRVFLGASEAVEKAPSAQGHLHVALVGTLEAVSRGRLVTQDGPNGYAVAENGRICGSEPFTGRVHNFGHHVGFQTEQVENLKII